MDPGPIRTLDPVEEGDRDKFRLSRIRGGLTPPLVR
jgi:hypothetical protein